MLSAESRALTALCAALGIPFDEAMLSWKTGPAPEDGVWGVHWYDAIWKSTGFAPPEEPPPPLPPSLARIADEVRADYSTCGPTSWPSEQSQALSRQICGRSLHWSTALELSAGHEPGAMKNPVKSLFGPHNRPALALRNFGLAFSVGLLPAWITIGGFLLPKLISSFLFNFGVVIAIGAIMLAYLNYAPEPSRISARFIGVSLVTSMLVLGAASIWIDIHLPDEEVHGLVLTFIGLVFVNTFFIIAVFPFFFRAALLEPINILLDGVQAANDGDLNVQVEVRYDDEVGLLARSFNRMISSIKSLTKDLQNTALVREREVTERTLELVTINQRLDRMLKHEQALASFSQVLLVTVTEEADQKRILTEALEHLRKGTETSRAYVFRNFMDPAEGECHALFAETCGPGVTPALPNSFNQKVPWSTLPQAIPASLRSGNSIGGLTEQIFSGHPFKDAMLSQTPPLYALLLFPIFIDDQWWGMMGFDDCESPRTWGESEVLLLRTASDMLGRSIQRWQLQSKLVDTLEQLEERVVERTISLSETNVRLNTEMTRREQYQQDLEQRLNSERMLARASVQLVETSDLQETMEILLRDLGDVIRAGIVCMAFFEPGQPAQIHRVYNWRDTPGPLFDSEPIHSLLDTRGWLWDQLRGFQTVYFADVTEMPQAARTEQELLAKMQISSFVAMPIKLEDRTAGVALCGNFLSEGIDISNSLQFIQVFSNLLSGQVQRENLLHTLEKRVAEQARELSNLYDMTLLGGESREIADILQPALFRLQEVSSSEAACIHFYSVEQHMLSLVAHHGIPQQQVSKLENIPVEGNFKDWLDDFVSNGLIRLQSHDDYTVTHSLNVCVMVVAKATRQGFPDAMVRAVGLAALLHDIGKELIPGEIPNKPGKLDGQEFARMSLHPSLGAFHLKKLALDTDLPVIVCYEHHVRYDRSGYPKVRYPEELHPVSLMTQIADVYDALRTYRPYRASLDLETTLEILGKAAGRSSTRSTSTTSSSWFPESPQAVTAGGDPPVEDAGEERGDGEGEEGGGAPPAGEPAEDLRDRLLPGEYRPVRQNEVHRPHAVGFRDGGKPGPRFRRTARQALEGTSAILSI